MVNKLCITIFTQKTIDIFNNTLIYNNNKINILLDIDNNIWFKFSNISNLLNYKNRKIALKDNVSKENKRRLKEIKMLFKINEQLFKKSIDFLKSS